MITIQVDEHGQPREPAPLCYTWYTAFCKSRRRMGIMWVPTWLQKACWLLHQRWLGYW